MKKDEEIVRALTANAGFFRIGSCETEALDKYADDWKDTWSEQEKTLSRLGYDYYGQHWPAKENGTAWYLEEKDDAGIWRVIGFGTAGKPFEKQCSEIVDQFLDKTYIYSCTNGFRDWSRIPKAKSRQELELKLAAQGFFN